MGHLEIAGFYANSTYQVQHGLDAGIFSQFDQVFSGHYHKKNSSGNISTWVTPIRCIGTMRVTPVVSTSMTPETGELEFVENPTKMFHKIYYNEQKKSLVNHTNKKDVM